MDTMADIIVVGHVEKGFLDRSHKTTYFQDGSVADFYTVTALKSDRVIKGQSKISDSSLDIIEPIGLYVKDGQRTLIKYPEYDAMKKDIKYLVFLKSNGMGGYSIFNMNDSRFQVGGPKDLLSKPNDTFHLRLLKEAQAKYGF